MFENSLPVPGTPSIIALSTIEKILVVEDQEPTANYVARELRAALDPKDKVFVSYDISTARRFMMEHPDMAAIMLDAKLPLDAPEDPKIVAVTSVQHTCAFADEVAAHWPMTLRVAWSDEMNEFLCPRYCTRKIPYKKKSDVPALVSQMLGFLAERRKRAGTAVTSTPKPHTPLA